MKRDQGVHDVYIRISSVGLRTHQLKTCVLAMWMWEQHLVLLRQSGRHTQQRLHNDVTYCTPHIFEAVPLLSHPMPEGIKSA